MDRRVWFDLGDTLPDAPERVRATLTVEHVYESPRYTDYEMFHGSVVKASLDTLDTPGVDTLRAPCGEWRFDRLPGLAKAYLLRTWEPL